MYSYLTFFGVLGIGLVVGMVNPVAGGAGGGIYCGYFGPGRAVMVLSTLTHDGRLSTHEI